MRQRLFAVLAALLLVAAAVAVRGLLIKDKNGGGPGGTNGPDTSSEKPVVACTPDLATVCEALAKEETIAEGTAPLDLDQAATPPDDIDGWITWDPAPQIANFDVTDGLAPWGNTAKLGSAELAALTTSQLRNESLSECEPLAWPCLSKVDPVSVSIGIGDPQSAEGLARLGPLAEQLAQGLVPDTLEVAQLRGIVDSPTISGRTDVREQLAAQTNGGTGAIGVVVGPRELLDQVAAKPGPRSRGFNVSVLKPSATVSVVVTSRDSSFDTNSLGGCTGKVAAVAAALRDAGIGSCAGKLATKDQAGFLYQVRKKAQ